jgi:hypothetical protein
VPICESEANLCPPVFQSSTLSPVNARIGIKSEWKGKKISGKKMETGFKGRIRTPRFQTLSCHFTRSSWSKRTIFLPPIFLPARLAWTATIPRRRFFNFIEFTTAAKNQDRGMGTKESDSPAPIFLPFLRLAATTALTKQDDNSHRKDTTLDPLSAPNLFAHPPRIGARRSPVAVFQRSTPTRIRAHL